jgi:hypothetical protein
VFLTLSERRHQAEWNEEAATKILDLLRAAARGESRTPDFTDGEVRDIADGLDRMTSLHDRELAASRPEHRLDRQRDWALYEGVDFGSAGAQRFYGRVASGAPAGVGGTVEVRLDDRSSAPVGGFAIANTGGWQTYGTPLNASGRSAPNSSRRSTNRPGSRASDPGCACASSRAVPP